MHTHETYTQTDNDIDIEANDKQHISTAQLLGYSFMVFKFLLLCFMVFDQQYNAYKL